MLDFCTLEDVKQVAQFSPRFDSLLEDCIKSVTIRFNQYMRRNLDYVAGKVEYFDVPDMLPRLPFRVWLEKKLVDPDTLVVEYDRYSKFEDDCILDASSYMFDSEKCRITLFGPLYFGANALRVTYNGGYPPLAAPDSGVMDCPAFLRQAAVEQVAFDADRRTNAFGGSNEADKKGKSAAKVGAFGLIESSLLALQGYRRNF